MLINKFKNNKFIKCLFIVFIIISVLYLKKINTIKIQNNQKEIVLKNIQQNSNTQPTVIHKANIDYIPKVSVIIPVYNTEKYLRKCLDSVINQTLKEIEIICVDDGSTDNSLNILKEYTKKDKRITIIKNTFNNTAKNIGLLFTKGEYIGFVNSKDWIDLDYYEKMYKIANKNNFDIVHNTSIINKNILKDKKIFVNITNSRDSFDLKYDLIDKLPNLGLKIFKNDFIKKYDLKNSNTKENKDLLFNIPAVFISDNIGYFNNSNYYQRIIYKDIFKQKQVDINNTLELYKQIIEKIKKYNSNILPFIEYKRRCDLKEIYDYLNKKDKQILADLIEKDFYIDFINHNKENKITIISPVHTHNKFRIWWGEYNLLFDLASSFKKQGYHTNIIYQNNNNLLGGHIYITFQGKYNNNIIGKRKKIKIVYILFPDYINYSKLRNYDIVIVASKEFNKQLRKKGFNSYYLPQFTNPNRFYPKKDDNYREKLLFIGNAHINWYRYTVMYAIHNNLPISIYGNFWDRYIEAQKYIKNSYASNNELYKYYSNADIVLNDTRPFMKHNDFISNRIYDVSACKGFLISDYIPAIEEIYGDSIPMYKSEEEFIKLVKYYMEHPKERKLKAEKAYKITLENYTNEVFVRELLKIVEEYSKTIENSKSFM